MTAKTVDCSPVFQLVGSKTGIDFTQNRRSSAEIGVQRAMERAGFEDAELYLARIAADEGSLNDLIDQLTVGETYFYREPSQFRFVRERVLPEIRERRGHDHIVRSWSAACSSGEEAYSLAMLGYDEGLSGRMSVLATDLSEGALAKARRGVYGSWSLRDEGTADAHRYLKATGSRFEVDEKIRRCVSFGRLNLAGGEYPSVASGVWSMDLIFCRNVLIYLDRDAVHRVAMSLFASLAEGGWLITASTDPPLSDEAPFTTVVTPHGVFYRRLTTPAVKAIVPPKPALIRQDLPSKRRRPSPPRIEVAQSPVASPGDDAVRRIHALAAIDAAAAERACEGEIVAHPTSAELQHLRAMLLLGLGRHDEASHAIRRALFLDPSIVTANLLLGTILQRCGDIAGARRAFRNARDLCKGLAPDQVVPFSDGEEVAQLIAAADAQIARLDELARTTR